MNGKLEDFKTGWFGLTLGLKSHEIDQMINTLMDLKREKSHFHLRSEFKGSGGIGDIEFYYQTDETPNNLELESSCVVYGK